MALAAAAVDVNEGEDTIVESTGEGSGATYARKRVRQKEGKETHSLVCYLLLQRYVRTGGGESHPCSALGGMTNHGMYNIDIDIPSMAWMSCCE